jgi:hypothetical protein
MSFAVASKAAAQNAAPVMNAALLNIDDFGPEGPPIKRPSRKATSKDLGSSSPPRPLLIQQAEPIPCRLCLDEGHRALDQASISFGNDGPDTRMAVGIKTCMPFVFVNAGLSGAANDAVSHVPLQRSDVKAKFGCQRLGVGHDVAISYVYDY